MDMDTAKVLNSLPYCPSENFVSPSQCDIKLFKICKFMVEKLHKVVLTT